MIMKRGISSALLISSLVSFGAFSAETKTDAVSAPVVQTQPENVIPQALSKYNLTVTDVVESPLKGFYEVSTNNGVIYANADASYFITGHLYQNNESGLVNLTEKSQAKRNLAQFKASGIEKELIRFPAKDEKFVINVFTDTSCGYCVKLHRELQQYNDLGITVRYFAYPRGGERASNFEQMASIWCADDQQKAMNEAKAGTFKGDKNVKQECKDLVRRHLSLGGQFGVTGTPAIMLADGSMVSGYVPAAQLIQILEANQQVK